MSERARSAGDAAHVVVEFLRTKGVLLVTLNRPERMNAWTQEMSADLTAAMLHADSDPAVRAVVITGAGRAFCAGIDIGEFTTRDFDAPPTRLPWSERVVPSSITKPVVAAINGHAVGIGLSYAMHCDVRFVASEAKLGFVFNRRGMVPEIGVHSVLQRVAGHGVAAELLISGRVFSGTEAGSLGIATEALPADKVLERAVDRAADVAANCSPASVGATKQLLWGTTLDADRRAMDLEDGLAVAFARQPDSREGMASFREKRRPQWGSAHQSGYELARRLGPHRVDAALHAHGSEEMS